MSRAIILAAVVAVASAGYAPMVELDSGNCIVKGDFINDVDCAVTVGSCDADNVVNFEYTKQGGYIAAEDDLCLATIDNSKKYGAQVVLTECNKAKASKWNLYADNTWMNGHKRCLAWDEENDYLVQVPCAEAVAFELDGCKVTPKPTVTVTATAAPAPTPVLYTCSALTSKWQCPAGQYVAPAYANVQSTEDGQSFVKNCCTPIPMRTCGQYSVQMGGPNNVCKSKYGNYQLTPYLNKQCSATDNKDCFMRCCDEVPTTQTCKAFVMSGTSYKPACPAGTEPIANLAYTQCAFDGSDCVDRCCETIVPQGNATCADWLAAPANGCPAGVIEMPLISCTPNTGIKGCDMQKCCGIPKY